MLANRSEVDQVNNLLTEVDVTLCNKIENDHALLIELADEMAERATKFEGQGYKSFLDSRAKFVSTLESICKDYKKLICILKH